MTDSTTNDVVEEVEEDVVVEAPGSFTYRRSPTSSGGIR